jgi:hemerythrin-like domain-containing protein
MSARRGGIAAAASFAEFRRGIERHVEVEERELFPAVEGGAETVLTATLPWKIQSSRLM